MYKQVVVFLAANVALVGGVLGLMDPNAAQVASTIIAGSVLLLLG